MSADTVRPEVGGVYKTRDGREVTCLHTNEELGEMFGRFNNGDSGYWRLDGGYMRVPGNTSPLDLVRCITPPPGWFERGLVRASQEVATWPRDKQEAMQVSGASEATNVITAIYPHRVSVCGRILVDHVASSVFDNAWLGEWETPLTEQLDPDKQYEMTVSLREVKP